MMNYLEKAVQVLRRQDVVAAPTETVYGLFGDATSDKAIGKIYEVKGRPSCNPLIIHVSSIEMVSKYCHLNDEDLTLLQKFWIDLNLPITFIVPLKKNSGISRLVTAGLDTIAIRRPNNSIALEMVEIFGKPLAAPSANTSMTVSPTSSQMVRNDLGKKIPFIVDGENCEVGLESTILDITKSPYVVLRHGGTPIEQIREICQKEVVENESEICIRAPGMMKKHYAPSIPLRMNVKFPKNGEAFIAFGETSLEYDENLSLTGDPTEAAHNLFSMIKRCDNPEKFSGIAVMSVPNDGLGRAINDRLNRASNHTIKKVLLVVLDGFGYSDEKFGNATLEAEYVRGLIKVYPHCLLGSSGVSVGLPEGVFGNSEVGHLTIGSGRIIKQKFPMITDSIERGDFDKNPRLIDALNHMKTCHIMGLFSDGGVHSHTSHFFHCLKILREHGVKIKAHLFLDGRDVAKDSALKILKDALGPELIRIGEIATIHGRYYAMDRNNNIDRTELSYRAIKDGISECKNVTDPLQIIENFYKNGVYDEEILPFVMDKYEGMIASDICWMVNFRTDRIKQILRLIQKDGVKTINMVNIDVELDKNSIILFEKKAVKNTLGEVISDNHMRQLRLAETEKYAHVTYFMNGGEDIQYEGEDRVLINSPDVVDYSKTPDMSAKVVTDRLVEALRFEQYEFIVVNYATPDMIGHTGDFEATKVALHCLDEHIRRVVEVGRKHEYQIIITADHGNAEHMINEDQTICKTHTCSPVPFICITNDKSLKIASGGALADIAPTVLKLLGVPKPLELTGKNLIV